MLVEFIRTLDGGLIRLTNERVVKILRNHDEMAGNMDAIPATLASPDAVTGSRSDPDVSLYYKLHDDTGYGNEVCLRRCVRIDRRPVRAHRLPDWTGALGELRWQELG